MSKIIYIKNGVFYMTFHEKSAAAILVLTVVIYGSYFFSAFAGYSVEDGRSLLEQAPHLIWAVVLMIVFSIGAHIVITIASGKEDRDDAGVQDERDTMILSKSGNYASSVLALGVVVAIGALILETPSFLIAHFLLAALVISEIIKNVLVLVLYRRGL